MKGLAPLRGSVFGRLVAVMLGTAACLLIIVSVFFFLVVGPGLGGSIHRLTKDYARLLAAEGLDEASARRLAGRSQIDVRYEGPGGPWTTSLDLPSIDAAEAILRIRDSYEAVVVPRAGGGRYLFSWDYGRRISEAHTQLLWLLLALVVAIVFTAHFAIRRLLEPLRLLHEGVTRLGAGELDVVVRRTSQDELGELTDAFNGMAERVRAMVRDRDQLLLDVSHELRSPLTRMKVALAMLPDGDKKLRMEVDVAEMEAMLKELLERERLKDGRGLRLETHDLAALVREETLALSDRAPGVRFISTEGPVPVAFDEAALRTVVRNLLENAAKYALPDSRVTEISIAEEGREAVFRVKDDGLGIPAADLASVFEPFFRVDRSRSRKTGGFGLGLSICRRVVEAHGGTISVSPNEARGVTFTVRLPKDSPPSP